MLQPAVGRVGDSLEERFWRKVQKTPECWLWLGATTMKGYGQMHVRTTAEGRVKWPAHHVSLFLAGRPLPSDIEHAHHICETPACVNPDHLLIVPARGGIRTGTVSHLTLHHARWDKQRLIAALHDCCRINGRSPVVTDFNKAMARSRGLVEQAALAIERGWPNASVIDYHFGSWSNAMIAAGFERPKQGRRPKACDVPKLM